MCDLLAHPIEVDDKARETRRVGGAAGIARRGIMYGNRHAPVASHERFLHLRLHIRSVRHETTATPHAPLRGATIIAVSESASTRHRSPIV